MRIVIGVDGSAPSRVALEMVASTRWPSDATMRLVSAARGGGGGRSETLERWTQRLLVAGYPTESVIANGRPADVLLAESADVGTDLLVVGSRGRGTASSALLGSVSAALVDRASCPVLVARRSTAERILVATDGSRSAEAIPSVLEAWGAFTEASVDVLAVRPRAEGHALDLDRGVPWMLGGERQVLEAAHDVDRYHVLADEMAAAFSRAGWSARPVVRGGDAAHEIEAAAKESDVDLIITGSRGLSGLQRRLLGSVAHHVLLHSGCSVLVMRGHVPGRERRWRADPVGMAYP